MFYRSLYSQELIFTHQIQILLQLALLIHTDTLYVVLNQYAHVRNF